MEGVPIISVHELQAELASPNPPLLVDVREQDERDISKLENDLHIPMGELVERIDELPPGQEIVIYCRTGNRSGRVTAYLIQQGYSKVRNLEGGINAWAREIDSSMNTY